MTIRSAFYSRIQMTIPVNKFKLYIKARKGRTSNGFPNVSVVS